MGRGFHHESTNEIVLVAFDKRVIHGHSRVLFDKKVSRWGGGVFVMEKFDK